MLKRNLNELRNRRYEYRCTVHLHVWCHLNFRVADLWLWNFFFPSSYSDRQTDRQTDTEALTPGLLLTAHLGRGMGVSYLKIKNPKPEYNRPLYLRQNLTVNWAAHTYIPTRSVRTQGEFCLLWVSEGNSNNLGNTEICKTRMIITHSFNPTSENFIGT
jgi:hypothetical protein